MLFNSLIMVCQTDDEQPLIEMGSENDKYYLGFTFPRGQINLRIVGLNRDVVADLAEGLWKHFWKGEAKDGQSDGQG